MYNWHKIRATKIGIIRFDIIRAYFGLDENINEINLSDLTEEELPEEIEDEFIHCFPYTTEQNSKEVISICDTYQFKYEDYGKDKITAYHIIKDVLYSYKEFLEAYEFIKSQV